MINIFLRVYYGPGIVLNVLNILTNLFLAQFCEVGTIFVPIQWRKMRLRKFNSSKATELING